MTVTPGDTLGWKPGKRLIIARLVDYAAYFASIGTIPAEGTFTFTVSWRGLIEPAQPLLLIHPYVELELPRTIVPVMDLTEQLAEKILEEPDKHLPPQGDASDDKARQLRFDATALSKPQAIRIFRRLVVPILLR